MNDIYGLDISNILTIYVISKSNNNFNNNNKYHNNNNKMTLICFGTIEI